MKNPLAFNLRWQKTLACLLLSLLLNPAFAQQQPAASGTQAPADKTKFMGKISHWLAAYGISSEDFMREKRNDFKAHAYAEVYIEAVIDHNAWMFTMLNRVTKAKYAEKQTPFILFGLKFKPKDDNLNSYEVSLSLEEGGAFTPQQDNGIVSGASSKHLGGKTYTEPVEAGEDIEKAIGEALDGIQARVGNSLAPNLMVRYQNEVFWNGHEIPILETEGNTVELEAIDKNGNLLNPDEIRWTNADPFRSKGVVDMTGIPSKQVTLTKGKDGMTVTLTRVSASQDIQDLLKILIIEILSTKKQEAIDTLAILRLDSTANAATIAQYMAALEAGNFPLEGAGELAPMFEVPRARSDSAAIMASNDVGPNLLALKKRKKVRSAIRRKVNVVALADLIVDQPDKVTILLDELLRSSGQLIARIILNRDSEGQRTQLRNIVLDFLNKNLERVAGGQYPASLSQEPPLEITAVSAQPPVFDPQKFLYINPRLNFPGKDELILQLRAGIPDTTYVFINYSQDVNLASYQARTSGTRPRGLPPGASYKVFTVLHMPGSLLEMHLKGEGGGKSQAQLRAFFAQASPHLLSEEYKKIVKQVKEIVEFLEKCDSEDWASYQNEGIVPYCFWRDAAVNPDDYYSNSDLPFNAGLVDGVYVEGKALSELPEVVRSACRLPGKLLYAYTIAYLNCKDETLELQMEEYLYIVDRLAEMEAATSTTERVFNWFKDKAYGYSDRMEEIEERFETCDDATKLRESISEFYELVTSWKEIRELGASIAQHFQQYLETLSVPNNVGRYERGRAITFVAINIIPIAATTRIGKLKRLLEQIKKAPSELLGRIRGGLAKGGDNIIDLAKAEQRYARTYASSTTKPFGLQMSLDEVEKAFGANGKKLVQEAEKKAKEVISQTGGNIQGDPVLTGLIDNKTGQIFYGRNLKTQSQIDDFIEELHPILKKRLEFHNAQVANGTVKATASDIQRAAIAGSHSEIVAMDQALKARGAAATEADLADFIIHNKQLGGQIDNLGIPKGCPPRCAHCWFLSDGIKVIGND